MPFSDAPFESISCMSSPLDKISHLFAVPLHLGHRGVIFTQKTPCLLPPHPTVSFPCIDCPCRSRSSTARPSYFPSVTYLHAPPPNSPPRCVSSCPFPPFPPFFLPSHSCSLARG